MPHLATLSALLLVLSAFGAAAIAPRRPAAAVRLARAGGLTALSTVPVSVILLVTDAGAGWTIDRLGVVVAGFVLTMSCVVSAFADRSLASSATAPRFFVATNLLAAGTVVFSVADHVAVQVAGWTAVSLTTLALIASDGRPGARAAARRGAPALIAGDLALLVAVGVAVATAGAGDGSVRGLAQRVADGAGTTAVVTIGLLLGVAAAARSGLLPFQRWLIGSIEAPTPVSAMLHAGVVNGSAVLLIRWLPAYSGSAVVVAALVAMGVTAMLVGVGAARTRPDIKGGLAWTTTAQMGFMIVQCALGLVGPAVVHLVGHGLFKSSLFLGAASSADHGMGAHPGRLRIRPMVAVAAGATAAVVVALALVAVRPGYLDHPAAVLPVLFLWGMTATALGRAWGRIGRPDVPLMTGSATAATVALVATVAISDLVDRATGLPHAASTAGAAALAVVVPVVVALTVLAVGVVAHRRPRIAGALWAWCAGPFVGLPRTSTTSGAPTGPTPTRREVDEVRAAIGDAATVLAPTFPLERFVAVNPLLGLEHLPSDAAAWAAVDELGARAELDETTYRRWHDDGRISTADLRAAAAEHLAADAARGDDAVPTAAIDELVRSLLEDAPVSLPAARPVLVCEHLDVLDEGGRATVVDETAAWWVARYLSTHLAWAPPRRNEGLWPMWRGAARSDRRTGRRCGPAYGALVAALPDDPAEAAVRLLDQLGVRPESRVAYLRRHLVRTPGWTAAIVATSGADGDDLLAYLALRLTVEASLATAAGVGTLLDLTSPAPSTASAPAPGAGGAERLAVWRSAYERGYRDHLLTQLSASHAGVGHGESSQAVATAEDETDAVGVFCIDPRSEGLRSAFEARGRYGTVGFAGFFGLPMAVEDLRAHGAVPSCPVIVPPTATFTEVDRSDVAGRSERRSAVEGAYGEAFSITKRSLVGPYATAENVGWFLGARMMARTLAPTSTAALSRRLRSRLVPEGRTTLEAVDGGWSADQRLAIASSIMRTTGLAGTSARLVVLCGHESRHENNLHRSALDCGACGGRSGANNARVAASLLNDPDVRRGLDLAGLGLRADTLVVAAVHETTTDRVRLLDVERVPTSHRAVVSSVQDDLIAAGRQVAAERAVHLPRSVGAVGVSAEAPLTRSADWAQVVPEWGLVGNAALVVGPRRLTAGHDLQRRVFLHTYDAEADADGAVLAAIVGGPLLVAHWISSQYRMSTIDPSRFGAGTKPAHNLVGGVGVIEGGGGDLRLGLPLESVSVCGRPVHEPMRLLVVIDAPASRIDAAIGGNPTVRRVADHRWIGVVGRPDGDGGTGWVVRQGDGRWQPWSADANTNGSAGAPDDALCGSRAT